MARKDKAPKPAPAEAPPAGDASPSGSRFLKLFLTIAGGLAAPALALAAFFLSGHSGDTGAKTAQLGGITITTRPGSTAVTRSPAPTTTSTTTTTTAPGPVAPPTRDPFAPLVNTAPAAPGK